MSLLICEWFMSLESKDEIDNIDINCLLNSFYTLQKNYSVQAFII